MGEHVQILWQCDQCSYEEWRWPDQEPWLCVICGWMRWAPIAERRVEVEETDAGAEPSPDAG